MEAARIMVFQSTDKWRAFDLRTRNGHPVKALIFRRGWPLQRQGCAIQIIYHSGTR